MKPVNASVSCIGENIKRYRHLVIFMQVLMGRKMYFCLFRIIKCSSLTRKF